MGAKAFILSSSSLASAIALQIFFRLATGKQTKEGKLKTKVLLLFCLPLQILILMLHIAMQLQHYFTPLPLLVNTKMQHIATMVE